MNARSPTVRQDIVDHRTYVFCGIGCLMEGVGQEAISSPGIFASAS